MESYKNLLIGVCKNYSHFKMVRNWAKSAIAATDKNTGVVLIVLGLKTPEQKKEFVRTSDVINERFHCIFEDHEAFVSSGVSESDERIHMARFLFIETFLNWYRRGVTTYPNVITTDVRDVVFVRDPFYVFSESTRGRFHVSVEGIKIRDESWNRNNIDACFGERVLAQIKDCAVLNVGTLGASMDTMIAVTSLIYQLTQHRKDWVSDQAAYNYLMHTAWDQFNQRYHTPDDSWAINLHVTMHPHGAKQFDPYLFCMKPYFDGTFVLSGKTKEPFTIVHQYDRVPALLDYFNTVDYNVLAEKSRKIYE